MIAARPPASHATKASPARPLAAASPRYTGQAGAALWLQRKCACGQGASALTDTCEDCQRGRMLGLQARLLVGAAHDPLEDEADRAAAQVLAPPGRGPAALRALRQPMLSRAATHTADGGTEAPTSVHRTLATAGDPLPAPLRRTLEPRFGHDFSRVRVHRDAQALQSAREVHAAAYTVGQRIVFGPGQYAPDTAAGRALLAHELAHVVQQGGGSRVLQRQLSAEALDDFDTDTFEVAQLESYLATHGPGRIEDNGDSDDKARRIVRLWKGKQAPFVLLTGAQKTLLIQEMQSGYTGNDDERGILALLLDSSPADLAEIFGAINPVELDSDFQGPEEDVLRAFYDRKFVGGSKAALRGSRRLLPPDAPAQASGDVATSAETAPAQAIVREGERDLVILLDPALKELAGVLAANASIEKPTSPQQLAKLLAGIKHPIGTMFVLSHGDDSASVKIGSAWHTPQKLAAALVGSVPAGKEPALVDFRGCRIGMSPPGMEEIRAALGAGAVVGSTCWMLTTPIGAVGFKAADFNRKPAEDQTTELNTVAQGLPRKQAACIIDRTAAAYIRAGGNMVAVWYTPRRTTEFDELYSKCQGSLTPKTVDPKLVTKSQSSTSHDCQLIRVNQQK